MSKQAKLIIEAGTKMVRLENGCWRIAKPGEDSSWQLMHDIEVPAETNFYDLTLVPDGPETVSWPLN